MVKLLLAVGANVNLPAQGPRSWTPLMFAHDDPAMLTELLAARADVNARTTPHWFTSPAGGMKLVPGGETALHLAAATGNAEAVRALLKGGADVEARAEDGCAPLDYAVRLGSITEAAEALVEAGAQLTPQRLEAMHASAHRPDSDLITFPFLTEPGAGAPNTQTEPAPNHPAKTARPQATEPLKAPAEFRCPKCHSLIYSRKPKICGHCGALLPPELLLTDQQAQALAEKRGWARELADKFGSLSSSMSRPAAPSVPQSASGSSSVETASPEELLRRVSCAEEFRHRDRPDFWLYVVGFSLALLVLVFLWNALGVGAPGASLIFLGFFAFLGYQAWQRASPICPNCKQNIRFCAPVFCHVCGQPLRNQRCESCEVDNSWTSFFRPYSNAGNFRWITYCPGCGVHLDAKVPRWQARG